MRAKSRGLTLVEFLVAGIISLAAGAALVTLVQGMYGSHATVVGQNAANADARAAVDSLADRIRGAQLGGGTSAALIAASPSEIAFWDFHSQYDAAQPRTLVPVRYRVEGGALVRRVNGLPANGETIVSGVESLAFVYYRFVPGSGWSATNDAAQVGAVKITATVANNGYRRTITAMVQVRQKRPVR